MEEGARVHVIAEAVLAPLPEGLAGLEVRRYRSGDLASYCLVVSATGDREVNDEIVEEARAARRWLNVVDDPARSSFFFMALHREGEVSVAVSTAGASPALARELRDRLAAALPPNVAQSAAALRAERASYHARGESTEGIDWRPRLEELLGPYAPR